MIGKLAKKGGKMGTLFFGKRLSSTKIEYTSRHTGKKYFVEQDSDGISVTSDDLYVYLDEQNRAKAIDLLILIDNN